MGHYAPVAPAFLPEILSAMAEDQSAVTCQIAECDNDAAKAGLLNGTYHVILFVSEAAHAELPLVILDRPVAGPYYQTLFDGLDRPPRIAARANSTEMVRALVGAGQGAAILNMHPMTDVTYGGARVVAIPIRDPLPPLTRAIGYDPARPRRLVQAFVAACQAHLAAPYHFLSVLW